MKIEKESVFLLSSTPYREADLIVNFLSPNHGRLSATIYGGKKIGKATSFPYHLGDYIDIDFQIQERNEFIKIYSVQKNTLLDVDHFSYHQFLFHCYFLELFRWIAKPGNPAHELTDLLARYNQVKWQTGLEFNHMIYFMNDLIKVSGFKILYDHCLICQKASLKVIEQKTIFRKQQYHLDINESGVICHACQPANHHLFDASMIKLLWMLDQNKKDFLKPIPIKPMISLLEIQHTYLTTLFDISPKSATMFFSEVKQRNN